MRQDLKKYIIESNKAIKILELSGYSFQGCSGNDFNKVHLVDINTGKLHTFKSAIEAKNSLLQ